MLTRKGIGVTTLETQSFVLCTYYVQLREERWRSSGKNMGQLLAFNWTVSHLPPEAQLSKVTVGFDHHENQRKMRDGEKLMPRIKLAGDEAINCI